MPSRIKGASAWADAGGAPTFLGSAGALLSRDADRAVAFDGLATGSSLVASGFTLGVPAGATLVGFEVEVTRRQQGPGGAVTDGTMPLRKPDGTFGDDRGDLLTAWPTSDGTRTYGGPADLWGFTPAPTPAEVNSADFRFYLTAANVGPLNSAEVDRVAVRAHWAGGRRCFYPASSWVHKVCYLPGEGVLVTFKSPHLGPYFTCVYPFTTRDDYDAFLVMASKGRWVHQSYWWRYYEPRPLEL